MGQDGGEGEEAPAPRRLTAIEALESYSSAHSEKVEELLEWPYRRFLAAMEAWRRRELVSEWNQRKLAHIAAMHANQTWDDPDNKKEDRLRELEIGYERVKAELMMSAADRQQIEQEADTEFMRAGRRAMQRAMQSSDPTMPGSESIRKLPG